MALCLPLRLNISNSTLLPCRGQLIHDQDFGSCVSHACYLHQPIPSPSTPPHTHTHTHTSVAWGSSLVRTLDALTIHVRVIQKPTIYTRPFCICNKTIINLIAISLQRHLLFAKACLWGWNLSTAAGQWHRGWTSFRISPEGSSPWPPWPVSSHLLLWAA